MIKLKINFTNDSGDGASINFKGNSKKASAILDILKAHIEKSKDIQETIDEIVELDVRRK